MGGTVTELGVVAETVNKQQEREIIYRIAYIHFCKFLSRAFCILIPVFCSPPLSRKLNIIHLEQRHTFTMGPLSMYSTPKCLRGVHIPTGWDVTDPG